MIIQCAWCKKITGEKEPLKDTAISHTLCKPCSIKHFNIDPDAEEPKLMKKNASISAESYALRLLILGRDQDEIAKALRADYGLTLTQARQIVEKTFDPKTYKQNPCKTKKNPPVSDEDIAKFIKLHAIASGGDWAQMLMSAIQNAARVDDRFAKLWKEMPDKSYDFSELLELIAETLEKPKTNPKSLSNITILKSSASGEYRVPGPAGTEAQAYYTDDKQDAIGTAKLMWKNNSLAIKFKAIPNFDKFI